MYIVLNTIDGEPKKCWTCDTWEEAVEQVVAAANEQDVKVADSAIREEVEESADYLDPTEHIRIYILQAENE